MSPCEPVRVLSAILLLFTITAYGAKEITLDISDDGLQQWAMGPTVLTVNPDTDIPYTINVNCNDSDTRSMYFVSEEMYNNCTLPTSETLSSRLQCPDSSDEMLVNYIVTLRPFSVPGIVPFRKGDTYHFVFYDGSSLGSLDNTSCIAGLKFALHIQDPATITTPTPTPTSTVVPSTTSLYTTSVAMTTTMASEATTSSTSIIRTTSTYARGDDKTTIVAVPTSIRQVLRPTSNIEIGHVFSGATPVAWPSLLLSLVLAFMTVIVYHYSS